LAEGYESDEAQKQAALQAETAKIKDESDESDEMKQKNTPFDMMAALKEIDSIDWEQMAGQIYNEAMEWGKIN
jgi:hypothetical protein